MRKYILFTFILFSLASAVYAARELDCGIDNCTNLVGYWKLNGDAADYSGNGNDGIVQGIVENRTGKLINAYYFGNSTSSYVNLTDKAGFDITGSLTMSFWIKFEESAINSGALSYLVGKSTGSSIGKGYLIFFDDRIAVPRQNTVIFNVFQASGQTNSAEKNDTITDGGWHHISGVFDDANNFTYLYADGVEIAKTSASYSTGTNDLDLRIGAHPSFGITNATIDEFMLWNKALNSSEIRKLFNLGASPLSNDSQFSTSYGTTDFDDVANISAVDNMKLAISTASVTWNNTVNATNQDYDTHINMDSDFVSINVSALDASINSSADISFTVGGCDIYTIYYSPVYYDNFQDIKDNGQVCDENSVPACTDIICENNILSFTVEHFDGYGGEGIMAVPEFSTWAMIIGLLGAFMGLSFIRKQD